MSNAIVSTFRGPYEDIEYLSKEWNYSELEKLAQELNNLISNKLCSKTYFGGLFFKKISRYLTHAGAYSGDAAWFMELCFDDYHVFVADRSAEIVYKKAIFWFSECLKGNEHNESFMADWKVSS